MQSIRKSILILSALFAVATANACSISYFNLDDQVAKTLTESGGFKLKKYNEVCTKLNKANAQLHISSLNGVASGRSLASVHVMVMDKKLPVVAYSNFGGSIQVNTDPSTTKSRQILADAINDAIDNLDIDAALASLEDARKLAK